MRKIFIGLAAALLMLAMCWTSCKKDNLASLTGGDCDTCEAVCDTSYTISYVNDIVPILEAKCYVCHNRFSAPVEADGHVLDNYNSLIAYVEDSTLMRSISWAAGYEPMPKDDDKLSDCKIDRIDRWIKQGYPNN